MAYYNREERYAREEPSMNPFRKKNVSIAEPAVPDRALIACADCVYQAESTVDKNDASLEYCAQYPYPRSKPRSILFNNAYCPYYIQKKP